MRWVLLCASFVLVLTGCTATVNTQATLVPAKPTNPITPTSKVPTEQEEVAKYQGIKPTEWGGKVTGVIRRLPTNERRVIALTFDACGGRHGSGYDQEMINYLIEHRIPATLFINSRWIHANPVTFQLLADNPLFEIENHGTEHRPLSVTGRSVYGIQGTKDIAKVYQEVNANGQKIKQLTKRAPKYFRSGTAFYDNVAVKVVEDLNEKPVNFDIIGDAGAIYNTSQVEHAMLQAKPGSIIILHMNQPKGDTAGGIKQAIPRLLQNGYHFVKLEDYLG